MKKSKLQSLLSLAPQPKPRKPMNKLQAHANRLTSHSAYDDYEEPTTKLSTAFVVVLALHVVAVGGIYAFHSIKAKRREADGTAVATKVVTPSPAVATAAAPASAQAPAAAALKAGTSVPVPGGPVPAAAPAASNGAPKSAAAAKAENPASHLPAPAGPSAVIPPQKLSAQGGQPAVAQAAAAGQANATVAAKAQPASVAPVKAVAVVQPANGGETTAKTYTVVKGDNPVAIAKKMHVSYEEMLKLNGIDDPKKLQIGQVLKMPPAKASN